MKKSIAVCVVGGLVSGAAQAATLSYPDFSTTQGLSINGTAEVVADNGLDPAPVLRLAEKDNFRSGSAFTLEQFGITRFSTRFTFRITPTFPTFPTDGFTFAMQTVRANNVGLTGGNLGFQGMSVPSGGANVGVEFDTFQNEQDNSNNHIGVDINTTASVQDTFFDERFSNGNLWFAWVDYDGTTLEVRANDTGTRPEEPNLAHEINLPDVIGDVQAHVGFTAATGGDRTAHELISWEYTFVKPGDANMDGFVTVADFAILQNHFNGPGGFKDGDFNNDGLVTFADFSILQNNFDGEGGTASVETLQAMAQALVPEPATLPLMAMILTAGAMRRKNRKRTEAR